MGGEAHFVASFSPPKPSVPFITPGIPNLRANARVIPVLLRQDVLLLCGVMVAPRRTHHCNETEESSNGS